MEIFKEMFLDRRAKFNVVYECFGKPFLRIVRVCVCKCMFCSSEYH